MARQAHLSDDEYAALVQKVADMGYDTAKLRKVPHNPK
ncbi:MAG: lipocalin family protein [Methylotenera sp.]